MVNKRCYISLKAKIMLSTLIPVIISFIFICTVIFVSLFQSLHETTKVKFLQIGQKYAAGYERKLNNAMNYSSIVASILEQQIETGSTDREALQKIIFNIFDNYELIDGSSIYFEPNMYDGKDAEYIGSAYGTAATGRICYYFYKDNGETAYLPEGLDDDIEFSMPHYTEAKKANAPIYTEPIVHTIAEQDIPMFTLTYPIRDSHHRFIGAVTVDLFLEDIYTQLQDEKIYETGYAVITNDKGHIICGPIFEDIGKSREEVGAEYALPSWDEGAAFSYANSLINGKRSFVATSSLYIPQLNSFFYISIAAPTQEIQADGIRLTLILALFSAANVIAIALLLYYRIGRIATPIKKITESANKIANGCTNEEMAFALVDQKFKTEDEVYVLFIAIKKMLSQLNEMQELKLETLELKHKNEKAEAAAVAKNDFLAKMSHEIRTPMNSVMGMSELILRKELPPDVYENAMGIKMASENLLSIINDILDFSKIESGKMEIIETEYLLPSLINDVVGIIRIRLVDKPILFAVNIHPKVPYSLKGDEIRIRQILINLLSNAVKYTNEGYISLNMTGDVSGQTVQLKIDVTDSGIGVKEENIDKLFGDFMQIDSMKNKGIEGTGLGLAISRNLCRAMGGDITVQSEYGKGSKFTITLSQKLESYIPFATIDEPGQKSVLLYETRQVYRESIIQSLVNLGVSYKNVDNISNLFDYFEYCDYVFISSFMYGSIQPALKKLDNPPQLVLLSDVTESLAPRDARLLSMPAYSLSIANIINGIYEEYGNNLVIGASFIAPDAKVLIADDIKANLKVCEGLLIPYEMQVVLCMNGQEAVDLVASDYYDLVFMDHMMPEMDGLEATMHIRAMEGEYFKNLPIVALTANAISGVREMFIQNGMNDFLAKPIETAKLNAILEKWIPKEKQIKSAPRTENEGEFVDAIREVPSLFVDKALTVVGGSVETYERIVKLAVRLLPENIARLDDLIETNLPNYAIEVHGVKGVLNNIGAYTLGDMAFELEKLSKNSDWEACKTVHPAFIVELTNFYDTISVLIDKEAVPDKPDGDKALILEHLPILEESAEFFDSARALETLSLLGKCTYGQEIDQTLADLAHAFECFDFDQAIALMEQLK